MPRAIWTGSISFGLVNVPVRMYSAIAESDLRFHLIHEPDGGRIGYQKICKSEGEPVPDEEIVKGFEFEPDEFVDAATVNAFGRTRRGYSATYRLDPREAIIVLGELPPPGRY